MSSHPPDPWPRLFELPRHGTGIALPRLVEICRPMLDGWWTDETLSLRVAGSNGKGSVATFAAEVLSALGLSTGLFTSPHLLHPGERIRIDGRSAADAEIAPAVDRYFASRAEYLEEHPGEQTGSFEALTAIALDHFQAAGVEAAVWEAGLGGRLDPTRLARSSPRTSSAVALVSLDLEHTDLLGDSLERIAYEKADLCPDGGVLVVGPLRDPGLEQKLAAYCRIRHVRPLFVEHTARIERLRSRPDGEPGTRFDLAWDLAWGRETDPDLPLSLPLRDLDLALPGPHQPDNAAVAVALVTAALHEAGRHPSPGTLAQAIRTGLARAIVPGRFERIRRDPDTYLDVAHTPAAGRTAADAAAELRRTGEPLVLVLGVSDEKQVEEIARELIRPLHPKTDTVLATRSRWHGAPVERVRRSVQDAGWTGPLTPLEDAPEALRTAIHRVGPDGLVLVAGSLYLAAEATCTATGQDPERLRFF